MAAHGSSMVPSLWEQWGIPTTGVGACSTPANQGLCDDPALDVFDWDGFGGHFEWPLHGLALWPIIQQHAEAAPW